MHGFALKVEKVLKNHWFEAFLGLVIMATGLSEAGETLFSDVAAGDIGAHHGIIIWGFVHTIKELPAILAGIAIFVHGAEHKP